MPPQKKKPHVGDKPRRTSFAGSQDPARYQLCSEDPRRDPLPSQILTAGESSCRRGIGLLIGRSVDTGSQFRNNQEGLGGTHTLHTRSGDSSVVELRTRDRRSAVQFPAEAEAEFLFSPGSTFSAAVARQRSRFFCQKCR